MGNRGILLTCIGRHRSACYLQTKRTLSSDTHKITNICDTIAWVACHFLFSSTWFGVHCTVLQPTSPIINTSEHRAIICTRSSRLSCFMQIYIVRCSRHHRIHFVCTATSSYGLANPCCGMSCLNTQCVISLGCVCVCGCVHVKCCIFLVLLPRIVCCWQLPLYFQLHSSE